MELPFNQVPIPDIFFQEAEQIPFSRCIVCDCDLALCDEYIIEKGFHTFQPYQSKDLVFEYAVCMPCSNTLSESFSESSRLAIADFFESRVDFGDWAVGILDGENYDLNKAMAKCIVTGKEIAELDSYQYVSIFETGYMTQPPILLSGEAVEDLVKTLSKSTKDVLGGFARDILPSPPGLDKDIPVPVLII